MNTRLSKPLLFAHIGDLHITDAKQQNYLDYLSILTQIESECSANISFVLLPGDNADNGKNFQYRLVSTPLQMLSMPVYIITGDHDMEQGSLDNFYRMPQAVHLPHSIIFEGIRCLFLDMCGSGSGGPDFRLGEDQLSWLKQALTQAREAGEQTVLFMHTYPADLKDQHEKEELNSLIANHDILLADMGHTHYNELANNGHTLFSATRSTGQIEEGPAGYSITSIQNGVVSWRFKPLHEGFPLVMITSPADYRLLTSETQKASGMVTLQAVVVGYRTIQKVNCRIGIGNWQPMTFDAESTTWTAEIQLPDTELIDITVEALDDGGRFGQHTITAAGRLYKMPERVADGSDKASIGAWPENGITGMQAGPNRNGKPLI